jgi:hypothetical protein
MKARPPAGGSAHEPASLILVQTPSPGYIGTAEALQAAWLSSGNQHHNDAIVSINLNGICFDLLRQIAA